MINEFDEFNAAVVKILSVSHEELKRIEEQRPAAVSAVLTVGFSHA